MFISTSVLSPSSRNNTVIVFQYDVAALGQGWECLRAVRDACCWGLFLILGEMSKHTSGVCYQ